MTRRALVGRIQELVGSSVLELEDPQQGWPALALVHVPGQSIPVAMFVGPVGLSHRERDHVERRFQNPGTRRPIVIPPGRLPLLIGLWEDDPLVDPPSPVLVSADARRREGRTTRYSVFAYLDALMVAATTGWFSGESGAGERVSCFQPILFASLVAAEELGVPLPAEQARLAAVDALGDESDAPEERQRRITSSLVRLARFRREVADAYSGRCAMCELGLGLVESAHVFPAAAEGAEDEVWNGVALCRNHHGALDRHLVWVDPDTREIRLHPSVTEARSINAAHMNFADGTRRTLAEPGRLEARPRASVFRRRYAHYEGRYDWAMP